MSERIASREIRTGTVAGERVDTGALPNSNERDRSCKKGVRQSNELASPPPSLADLPKRPAHPSHRLIAQLNASWRVVDDPLQWILQRRKGNSRAKNTGWRARSYCRTKDALLRCIREHCCLPDDGSPGCIEEYRGMDGAALQQIRALPEWHIDLEERLTTAPSGDDPALASDETQR